MQEVLEFLKKNHVFYIATVDGDQPRVRPFGVAEEYEGHLYTQTGKIKNVSKQLQANPKAEICCFGDGKWLRIECKLVRDDRVEVKKALLDKNPNLRKMYDENDDNTEALRFDDVKATFYSFTEAPRTVEF